MRDIGVLDVFGGENHSFSEPLIRDLDLSGAPSKTLDTCRQIRLCISRSRFRWAHSQPHCVSLLSRSPSNAFVQTERCGLRLPQHSTLRCPSIRVAYHVANGWLNSFRIIHGCSLFLPPVKEPPMRAAGTRTYCRRTTRLFHRHFLVAVTRFAHGTSSTKLFLSSTMSWRASESPPPPVNRARHWSTGVTPASCAGHS